MPKDPDTMMDSLEDLEDDVDVPVMGMSSPEASNASSPAIKHHSRLKRLDTSKSANDNQQKKVNIRVRVTHHYSEDESEDGDEDVLDIQDQDIEPASIATLENQLPGDGNVGKQGASRDEAEEHVEETAAESVDEQPKEEEEFWDEEDELAQTLAPPSSGPAADHDDGDDEDEDAASGHGGDSETEMDNPWRAARGGPERIGGSDSVMLPVEAPAMSDVLARMQARKAELAARAKAKLPNAVPAASNLTVPAQEAAATMQQPISFSDLLARAKAKRKQQQQQQQQTEVAVPVNQEPALTNSNACLETTVTAVGPHATETGADESRPLDQNTSTLHTDQVDAAADDCMENHDVVGDVIASVSKSEDSVLLHPAVVASTAIVSTTVPAAAVTVAPNDNDEEDIELEIVEDAHDQQHQEQVSAAAAELAELQGMNPAGATTGAGGLNNISLPGLPTRKTFGRGILGRTAARLGSVVQVNHGVVVPAARMDSTETQHAAALLAAGSNPGPALQGSAAQAFIDQDAECDEDEIEMSGSESDDERGDVGSDSEMVDATQHDNEEGQQDASEDGSDEGEEDEGDGSGSGSEDVSDDESDKPENEEEQLEPEPLAFEEDEPELEDDVQQGDDQAAKRNNLLDKMREGQRLLELAKKKKAAAAAARAAAGHGGFIEAEAELSDDEGLGLGGGGVSDDEEEGQGDDAMLADLLGTAKEGAKDESRRLKLHHQWEHERDNVELQKVVHAMRHGYKRNNADRRMLGGEDGTDADARRRRAMLFGDTQMEAEDEAAQGEATWVLPLDKDMEGVEEEEEGQQEAANDTAYAAEQHEMRKRLRTASRSEERTGSGSGLSHKASDEIRALMRTAKAGEGPVQSSRQPGKQPQSGQANNAQPAGGVAATKSTFAIFGRDLTNKAAQATAGPGGPSFVGRAAAIAHRTSSTMGGRSFVFGSSEHSNSAAAATLQEASKDTHTNPAGRQGSNAATSFAEVKNMISNAKSMAPPTRQHSGAAGQQGAKFDANLFKLLRHTSA